MAILFITNTLVTDQPIESRWSFVTSLTASHPWQLNRYPLSASRVSAKLRIKLRDWFVFVIFFLFSLFVRLNSCFISNELVLQRKRFHRFDVQFSAIHNSFLICQIYFKAINIYARFANMNWLVTHRAGFSSRLLDELSNWRQLCVHWFTMGNLKSKSNFLIQSPAQTKCMLTIVLERAWWCVINVESSISSEERVTSTECLIVVMHGPPEFISSWRSDQWALIIFPV